MNEKKGDNPLAYSALDKERDVEGMGYTCIGEADGLPGGQG